MLFPPPSVPCSSAQPTLEEVVGGGRGTSAAFLSQVVLPNPKLPTSRCSKVAEGLFLGSDTVARSREVLREARVSHVLNCVGFLSPEYFADELEYKTLWLQGRWG